MKFLFADLSARCKIICSAHCHGAQFLQPGYYMFKILIIRSAMGKNGRARNLLVTYWCAHQPCISTVYWLSESNQDYIKNMESNKYQNGSQ